MYLDLQREEWMFLQLSICTEKKFPSHRSFAANFLSVQRLNSCGDMQRLYHLRHLTNVLRQLISTAICWDSWLLKLTCPFYNQETGQDHRKTLRPFSQLVTLDTLWHLFNTFSHLSLSVWSNTQSQTFVKKRGVTHKISCKSEFHFDYFLNSSFSNLPQLLIRQEIRNNSHMHVFLKIRTL